MPTGPKRPVIERPPLPRRAILRSGGGAVTLPFFVYATLDTPSPGLYSLHWRNTMRMTGVRDFRAHLTRYVSGEEPVLLTRHGKVSGLYLPLEDASRVPDDLRRELASVLGAQGVGEREIGEDFRAHRRHRR
jgi:hypothetical protein